MQQLLKYRLCSKEHGFYSRFPKMCSIPYCYYLTWIIEIFVCVRVVRWTFHESIKY